MEAGQGGTCSIVCTQPRRIAAISVAERVAAERGEAGPGQPGCKVGLSWGAGGGLPGAGWAHQEQPLSSSLSASDPRGACPTLPTLLHHCLLPLLAPGLPPPPPPPTHTHPHTRWDTTCAWTLPPLATPACCSAPPASCCAAWRATPRCWGSATCWWTRCMSARCRVRRRRLGGRGGGWAGRLCLAVEPVHALAGCMPRPRQGSGMNHRASVQPFTPPPTTPMLTPPPAHPPRHRTHTSTCPLSPPSHAHHPP